jgi:glyoxylase-like metal-dependent hydrolase (beta-lactamase superfamily II)
MSWRGVGCFGASVLVGVALLAGGVLYATFSGMGAIEDQRVLSNGAIVLQDGYVSMFLVPLADRTFALVDVGNDPAGAAVDRVLAARRAVRDDVKVILLTHAHPDHVAACGGFEDARIYVMRDELKLLRGEVAAGGPLPRLLGARESACRRDRVVAVEDGAVVPLGGGRVARAMALPGHTAGSAAWWIDGVLFLGDAADADAEGRVTPAKWLFSDDQRRAARSLRELAARVRATGLQVDALAFSHTGVLDGVEPLLAYEASREGAPPKALRRGAPSEAADLPPPE